MSKYDRYRGPLILALIVIGIVALILFYSTSPRTGINTALIFLIAVGLAMMVLRKLIR
jgi:hypothetical protein